MAPTDWFTRDKDQEIVLEPYYRLMSYLCKRLFKDEILSEFAHKVILDIVPAKWLVFDGEESEDQSKNGVFKLISNLLKKFMAVDKRKWIHKLYWKYAWIQYNIFRDAVEAKAKFSCLFHLKPTTKAIQNFWSPAFGILLLSHYIERPGKYYLSINKYASFMILLLGECNDIEQMRVLVKKLRKEKDSLIYPAALWKLAYETQFKLLTRAFTSNGDLNLAGSILKKNFDYAAPLVESKLSSVEARESVRVIALLCASELYKMNDGVIADKDLKGYLVDLYSEIFKECGGVDMEDPESANLEQSLVMVVHVLNRAQRFKLPALKVLYFNLQCDR
jgi:hypothetical protein